MMDLGWAKAFVEDWVEGWNTHGLDRVLRHFTEDVTFSSPVAAQLIAGSNGVIRGKDALRSYWEEGLQRIPDLHFDIEGLYLGINALVVNYRNQKGSLVGEVLISEGLLVSEGFGTYSDGSGDLAGATTPSR